MCQLVGLACWVLATALGQPRGPAPTSEMLVPVLAVFSLRHAVQRCAMCLHEASPRRVNVVAGHQVAACDCDWSPRVDPATIYRRHPGATAIQLVACSCGSGLCVVCVLALFSS